MRGVVEQKTYHAIINSLLTHFLEAKEHRHKLEEIVTEVNGKNKISARPFDITSYETYIHMYIAHFISHTAVVTESLYPLIGSTYSRFSRHHSAKERYVQVPANSYSLHLAHMY